MAVYVPPYNGWREQLAASILSPIISGVIQRSQQANQNRKLNALRGVVQDELASLGAPQQTQIPQVTPADYNSDGWQSAFHSSDSPLAQFNTGTSELVPSVTPQINNYMPTQADIQNAIARNIATKRFSMLDPKLVQESFTPMMQAAEAQRLTNLRNQYATGLQGANSFDDQVNLIMRAAMEGAANDNTVKSMVDYAKHRQPDYKFSTVDAGDKKYTLAQNPATGQVTPMFNADVGVSPNTRATLDTNRYIADQTADLKRAELADTRLKNERDYSIKDRIQTEVETQGEYNRDNPKVTYYQDKDGYYYSIDPKTGTAKYVVDDKGNRIAGPVDIKGGNNALASRISYAKEQLKGLQKKQENAQKRLAEAKLRETAYSADQSSPEYKSAHENVQSIEAEIKQYQTEIDELNNFVQNGMRELETNNTTNAPSVTPRAQLGNSSDIGLNILNGARNVRVSSHFNSSRPNGRKHMGADYAAEKGEHILVPDVGTTLTVKSVGNDPHNSYGNHVVLEGNLNGHKIEIVMAHMDNGSIKLQPGQKVTPGDLVGFVGNTGNTSDREKGGITNWYEGKKSGYHLHLETKLDGVNEDPAKFYDKIAPFMQNTDAQDSQANLELMEKMTQQTIPEDNSPVVLRNSSNGRTITNNQLKQIIKDAENGRIGWAGNREEVINGFLKEGYEKIGLLDKSDPRNWTPSYQRPDLGVRNETRGLIPNTPVSPDVTGNIPNVTTLNPENGGITSPDLIPGISSSDVVPDSPQLTVTSPDERPEQQQAQLDHLNGFDGNFQSNDIFSLKNTPSTSFGNFSFQYGPWGQNLLGTGPVYGTPEFDELWRRNMEYSKRAEREILNSPPVIMPL